MIDYSTAEKTLLELIRGNLPISSLEDIGTSVSFEGGLEGKVIKIKSELSLVVSPTIFDIVQGLVCVPRGRDLSEWASFIQATDLISFDEVEKHPQSDELINALWDASFDGTVDSETVKQLTNLVR